MRPGTHARKASIFSQGLSSNAQLLIGTRPRTGEYTYLVGHAWDLMRALFEDLLGIWAE